MTVPVLDKPEAMSPQSPIMRAVRLASCGDVALAARAARTLEAILAPTNHSLCPDDAWSHSSLTSDGYPLEFSFSSGDPAIDYIAEIAGPETPPQLRLQQTSTMLRRLGISVALDIGILQTMQGSGNLTWGSWLGARHSPNTPDRLTVFAEIPRRSAARAAEWFAHTLCGAHLLPNRETPIWAMSQATDGTAICFHFHRGRLSAWEIRLLLGGIGCAAEFDSLMQMVELAYGYPIPDVLPGSDNHWAIGMGPGGKPFFTLRMRARTLSGPDSAIRHRLMSMAARLGWAFEAYASVSAPVAMRNNWQTFHGDISFTVSEAAPVRVDIGMRPPDSPLGEADHLRHIAGTRLASGR